MTSRKNKESRAPEVTEW